MEKQRCKIGGLDMLKMGLKKLGLITIQSVILNSPVQLWVMVHENLK